MPAKAPSRQARWQAKQKAAGRCIICPKKAAKGSTRCSDCLLTHRVAARAAGGYHAWREGGPGRRPILKN